MRQRPHAKMPDASCRKRMIRWRRMVVGTATRGRGDATGESVTNAATRLGGNLVVRLIAVQLHAT